MRLLAWLAIFAVALPLLAVAAVFTVPLIGYESRVITGGSMAPKVPVGSVIISRSVGQDSLNAGDIVTYRRLEAGTHVTHRIVAVRTERGQRAFTLKGDANPASDPEEIVFDGPVTKLEMALPYLGFVIGFARSPLGLVLLLLVSAGSLRILGLLDERDEDGARPTGT